MFRRRTLCARAKKKRAIRKKWACWLFFLPGHQGSPRQEETIESFRPLSFTNRVEVKLAKEGEKKAKGGKLRFDPREIDLPQRWRPVVTCQPLGRACFWESLLHSQKEGGWGLADQGRECTASAKVCACRVTSCTSCGDDPSSPIV